MFFTRIAPLLVLCIQFVLATPVLSFSSVTGDPEPKSSPLKNKRTFKSLSDDVPSVVAKRDFYTEDYAENPTDNEQDIRSKIEATYNKVFEENRFIDFLDENALLEFPVGLKTDIGVLKYTILIDSVVMTPRESFLYASMLFEIPQTGKKIHFIGKDIKFSKSGGLSGDGKLLLVGDYAMNLDGNNSQLVVKGSREKTFAEFDCSGFKQLSIDASLVFSRNLLEPEDKNGEVPKTGNVAIDFTTTLTDWNNILIAVDVPKFRVNGLKDITFSITDAVLDFSDTQNPLAINFPKGYTEVSPLLIDGNLNLWRGVYLKNFTITLPPQFETKNEQGERVEGTGHRVSFQGSDVIMDNVGFSGRVSANNLIPINKGKIGNWAFSLESINLVIAANELKEGGFKGKVNIPINKTDETSSPAASENKESKLFSYSAVIKTGNEYLFNISNASNLNFDLWKASVTLKPSSYIDIKLIDGKFLPKAHLNGEMTMNLGLRDGGEPGTEDNKNVKIAKVSFESLEVQSVKPYVKVGSFSLGTEGMRSGMGGFPIRINEIGGASSGNEISLTVDLTLSLVGESDGGFAADGKFKIISEGNEQGDYLSYRFKKIELERFGIDIDKGSFKFKGTLNFYKEDPVYGNGISGTVDATFQPTFKLQASAIFGTRNGTRYWYVDALAAFNSGIPIFSGVAIYSFGGGAYYHMKMDNQGVGSPLGKTVSGITYVPDEGTGFGFKATIGFGIQPGKKAFNADVTYEMAFNTGGGVKYINFRGNGYFLTSPVPVNTGGLMEKANKLASLAKKYGSSNLNDSKEAAEELYGPASAAGARAQVWASTMINYDFDNRTLHGNLKAYINVAGGLIKGGGTNGLAGEAVMHFGPGEWYIYIGRPEYENRFALKVLGIATLDAYFVIGTSIPDSPPPPENVSSILGGIDLDYMKELNALGDGAGVGFGASFRVDTGDITFLMFYGRFAAGLGFDIMLKNYGDVQCKGEGALGINGWYANGQAYAYFEGNIGIRVRIFRRTKKIRILEIGAAVVAQAKLPNPTWVRGIAGGYFRVLGGLVKGRCRFEIEIGKECEIVRDGGSVLESVEVLAQTTPTDQSQKVDVFVTPQAIFNYEMEKEYEMVDEVSEQIVKFKISLDKFTLQSNGAPLQAEIRWNDDKTVAAINPFEILPPNQELLLEIVFSFKEQKGGSWVTTFVDGAPLTQTHQVKFTTGEAPDYIPRHNIAYSYPTIDQYNFYKNESDQGYITLKQGQSYLFAASDTWRQVIRFESATGQISNVPMSYITEARELRFQTPQNLANNQLYRLSVVNVPKTSSSIIDSNVTTSSASVATSTPDTELNVQTKQAEGIIAEAQEKELYNTNFRTSHYNTFREKMVSVNLSTGWRNPIVPGVHSIGANMGGPEPFSYDEMYGSQYNKPLIQPEADLSQVPWFQNSVFPLVYKDYPINGKFRIRSETRNTDILGVIPTKAVILVQIPWEIKLTSQELDSRSIDNITARGRIDYLLAWVMYNDYLDLSYQAANYIYTSNNTQDKRLNELVTSVFPVIKKGDYWVNVKYVLPGKSAISSIYRHKIDNPVD